MDIIVIFDEKVKVSLIGYIRIQYEAHYELIPRFICNVFEFTANYDSYEQSENDKILLPRCSI